MTIARFVGVEKVTAGDVGSSNGWVLLAFGLLERCPLLFRDGAPLFNIQCPPAKPDGAGLLFFLHRIFQCISKTAGSPEFVAFCC